MISYNLIDEEWLPIFMTDGSFREVSLSFALAHAHEIREVVSDSPLEVIALNRFLQAFVLRIFECHKSMKNWQSLLEQKCFSEAAVKDYLETWRTRFDLFDAKHPFYQHTSPAITNRQPIDYLLLHRNNNSFFEHNDPDGVKEIRAANVAIGLITTQAYSLGGLIAPGKPNARETFYLKRWIFWVRGKNLFESLVLNSAYNPRIYKDPEDDVPAWEQENNKASHNTVRQIDGYLDYLTWQSRMMLIAPPAHGISEEDEELFQKSKSLRFSTGEDHFSILRCQQYYSDSEQFGIQLRDPLMCFLKSKEGALYQLRVNREKSLWRDSELLYRKFDENGGGTCPNLSSLAGMLDHGLSKLEIMTFGIVNDQGMMCYWKTENLHFYTSILNNGHKAAIVGELLAIADKQLILLEKAVNEMAINLVLGSFDEMEIPARKEFRGKVFRSERAILSEGRITEKNRSAVNAAYLTTTLAPHKFYWPRLEHEFYTLLDELAAADLDDSNSDRLLREFINSWIDVVFKVARDAYKEATRSFTSSAKHIKAQTKGFNKLFKVKYGEKNG